MGRGTTNSIELLACAALLSGSGCLWTSDFPAPDKVQLPVEDLAEDVSHCNPMPNTREPVLLGPIQGPHPISCRIAPDAMVEWLLEDSPVLYLDVDLLEAGHLGFGERVLARNVESIVLHPESLPWSPRPYTASLRLTVTTIEGNQSTKRWPLIILPGSDVLIEPTDPPSVSVP